MGNPKRGFLRFPEMIPPPGIPFLFRHRLWRAYPTAKSPLCTMHPPRDIGPVSYRVSQNNPGASRALAFVALKHPPCPTHNYRRHKAGVPVMARLQREHLPPLSAAACLAWSLSCPTRCLSPVDARCRASPAVSSRRSAFAVRDAPPPILGCIGTVGSPGHLAAAKLLPVSVGVPCWFMPARKSEA